jgi:hypothetical protein
MAARLLFFGDQRLGSSSHVKTLHRKSQRSLALSRFLRDVSDVLKTLFEGLQPEDRGPYSQFESIVELAEMSDEHDSPHELVSGILFFVALFGDLIL